MKIQKLSISEQLIKERAEVKANEFAKVLITEQRHIDASDNISTAIAKVLPFIKSDEMQNDIYQLLLGASASCLATNAKLAAALKAHQELLESQEAPEPLEEPEAFEEIETSKGE